MTVYVRTFNGKTISIKCNRQQKAVRQLETAERKTPIPRGMMYLASQRKVLKTKEENIIEAGTTIEMSLRKIGWMEKEQQMEITETEEDLKKRTLMEMCKSKSSRPSDSAVFLRKEIINAIRRSDEKLESYIKRTDEKMDIFSTVNHELSRNPAS